MVCNRCQVELFATAMYTITDFRATPSAELEGASKRWKDKCRVMKQLVKRYCQAICYMKPPLDEAIDVKFSPTLRAITTFKSSHAVGRRFMVVLSTNEDAVVCPSSSKADLLRFLWKGKSMCLRPASEVKKLKAHAHYLFDVSVRFVSGYHFCFTKIHVLYQFAIVFVSLRHYYYLIFVSF